MAIFTWKKNLSLNVLTSEEFHNLAIMFISYGASLNSCPKPNEVALKSFASIKRDKLKYIMTTTAFKKHGRTLALFSQIPYVSIAMDEGKKSKNQNLHFVIEAPFS
ncbi:hypothetical protein M9Y10_010301 [Tritrichomonas musculus]|uniref:Uncharacterized protein n=1 Tax=Tritrichomonas musculus TaxID=1915356 RepID=A0ABR2IL76_9EUKA